MSAWVLIFWFTVRDGRSATAIDVASRAQCHAVYAEIVAEMAGGSWWRRTPDGYVCVERKP